MMIAVRILFFSSGFYFVLYDVTFRLLFVFNFSRFLAVLLADRTNGRAYATVLRLSSVVVVVSVVCDVMYCG